MSVFNREMSALCVALYEQKYTYTQIAEYFMKRDRVMVTRFAISGYLQRAAQRGELTRRKPVNQSAIRDACIALAIEGRGYTETTALIQEQFGLAITRNKVAGFVNRARNHGVDIPFKKSIKTFKPKEKVAKAKKARVVKFKPSPDLPAAPPEPELPFKLPEGVPTGMEAILGLSKYACAWPIGDPKDDAFRYCCTPVAPEDTYCIWHRRLGTVTKSQYRENAERRRLRYG